MYFLRLLPNKHYCTPKRLFLQIVELLENFDKNNGHEDEQRLVEKNPNDLVTV